MSDENFSAQLRLILKENQFVHPASTMPEKGWRALDERERTFLCRRATYDAFRRPLDDALERINGIIYEAREAERNGDTVKEARLDALADKMERELIQPLRNRLMDASRREQSLCDIKVSYTSGATSSAKKSSAKKKSAAKKTSAKKKTSGAKRKASAKKSGKRRVYKNRPAAATVYRGRQRLAKGPYKAGDRFEHNDNEYVRVANVWRIVA